MSALLRKVASIVSDFKTIWGAGIAAIAGVVLAADARYITHDHLDRRMLSQEARVMSREIKELQLKIDLNQATPYDRALLQMKRQEFEQLKSDVEEKK